MTALYCIGCGSEAKLDFDGKSFRQITFKHIKYGLCGSCFVFNFYPAVANKSHLCPNCGRTLMAEISSCPSCEFHDVEWDSTIDSMVRKHIRGNQRTVKAFCSLCNQDQKHAVIKTGILRTRRLCVECGQFNGK